MVLVFGSVNLDLVARVPRIPAPGETLSGTAFAVAPGGKGANQALAARQAGARVVMHGAVGDDAFAKVALANLVAAGVAIEVARAPGPTGVALINVDERGENAITVVAGANAKTRAAQVPDRDLDQRTTLLMQLEVPLAEVDILAARARQRGARIVLNAAPAAELAPSLLRNIDVLVVNEHEARICADHGGTPREIVAHMHKVYGLSCVVTLGSEGVLAADGDGIVHVPAPKVDVVDTTGAGDAFAGALAAALDAGETLHGAVVAGVRAGAACCTYAGAQRANS